MALISSTITIGVKSYFHLGSRMKLLVVIALLGFAAAGPREHHVNFCRGNSEAREDAGALRAVIQIFLPNIIGYSEPFKHKDFGCLKP